MVIIVCINPEYFRATFNLTTERFPGDPFCPLCDPELRATPSSYGCAYGRLFILVKMSFNEHVKRGKR